MADSTEATAQETEVTAPAEGKSKAESTIQEATTNDLAAKISEYEAQLKEFDSIKGQVSKLEKEKKDAEADSLRWQATYRGLQKEATQKLQEAARVRQEAQSAARTNAELSEVKEVLNALASRVLDEEERKEMEFKRRENRIKAAEEAQLEAYRAAQQQQPTQQIQYREPTDQRKEFLSFYYSGVDLDPSDPRIDWASDATSQQEAFRRVNVSVLKIKEQQEQAKAQELAESVRKEALSVTQDLEARTKAELESVKAEALKTAREEQEKRLRKLGIDTGTTPPPESRRKLQAQLNEDLSEDLLYKGRPGSKERKEGEMEYQRRLDALKKQLRGQ